MNGALDVGKVRTICSIRADGEILIKVLQRGTEGLDDFG